MSWIDKLLVKGILDELTDSTLASQIDECRRRMREHTPNWNGTDADALFLIKLGGELTAKAISKKLGHH